MKISLCNQRIEQELLELQKNANIWDEKFPESFRDQFEDEAQQVKQVKVLMQDLKKSFLSPACAASLTSTCLKKYQIWPFF